MPRAFVGLGANLGDPAAQLAAALEAIGRVPNTRVVKTSSLYRTAPIGYAAQPDFVNAVAGLLTRLAPRVLLDALKALEATLGREAPVVRWGPRRIDLDLLVYGAARIEEPGLVVPHPGLAARAFVLQPLSDVAPDLEVPGLGRVRSLAARVDAAGLARIAA